MSVDMDEVVKMLEKRMQCNCDLDNWQPELLTGHSFVCRIHKSAKLLVFNKKDTFIFELDQYGNKDKFNLQEILQ